MNRAARRISMRVVEFDGDEWLHFRPLRPDVAIIRGATADARGNISMEHEAAPLGTFDLALAARNAGGLVIAQVKRRAPAAPLPTARCTCLLAGRRRSGRPGPDAGDGTPYDPDFVGRSQSRSGHARAAPFGIEKVIARRAAMGSRSATSPRSASACSAGAAYHEEGLHGQVAWTIEQGPVGGVPVTGFAFGCALNAGPSFPRPSSSRSFRAPASTAASSRSCRSTGPATSTSPGSPSGPI